MTSLVLPQNMALFPRMMFDIEETTGLTAVPVFP